MNVKKLKSIISQLPDEMEVYIPKDLVQSNEWLSTVEKPRTKIGFVKDGKLAQRPCKATAGAKKCLIIS